jgi:hypothetical protein
VTGINRNPSGLLDLLQVQAGGQNPDNLAETVRPIVDIEPFYWPDRMRGFNEAFSLNTGQIDFIEVPAGEVWKLLTIGHVTTSNVSTAQSYCVTYGIERLPGQGLNGIEFGGYVTPVTASAMRHCHYVQLPAPVIVTAGQRLTLTMHAATSGPITGDFEVVFVLVQRTP